MMNVLQSLGILPSAAVPGIAPAAPPPIVDAPAMPLGINPPAPGVNAFQGLNPAPVAPAPQASSTPTIRPARSRSSVLDVIGRVSDVLARVGGAEALYQPTLDARQDRELALGNQTRQIDMDKLKLALTQQQIAAGQGSLGDAERARLGQAVRGLQAIRAGNPAADISSVWPMLAQQAGVPPEQIASLGQAITQNPALIEGLADAINGKTDKYTGNVVYAMGPDGKLAAFQPGLNANARPILPEGYTAIDPVKAVNTGGDTQLVGSRSGKVQTILPNTEAPGKAADRAQRSDIAAGNNATSVKVAQIGAGSRITVAGMPARGKTGGKADPAAIVQGASPVVSGLRDAVTRLYKSGGMSGPANNVLNVIARENVPGYERLANPQGYTARQDLDRLLTVGIPSLLPLMGGLTLGGKNIDAAKELDTWRKAIASSKDYPSAMRAVEGFEARLREMRAAPASPASSAPQKPARAPVKPRANSSAGGWSVIGVK